MALQEPILVRLRPSTVGFGSGLIVAGAVVVGQWLFNDALGFHRFYGIGFVGPVIGFGVTAALVTTIQVRARQRRRARMARAQVVADCNHEIRNALQAMVGVQYPNDKVEIIQEAVARIDWALRDLLPHVQDEDGPTAGPRWNVQGDRLKVKNQTSRGRTIA